MRNELYATGRAVKIHAFFPPRNKIESDKFNGKILRMTDEVINIIETLLKVTAA